MKYQINDIVRIKSKNWYEQNKVGTRVKWRGSRWTLHRGKVQYCGKRAKIVSCNEGRATYHIDIDGCQYEWHLGMFEDQITFNAPSELEQTILNDGIMVEEDSQTDTISDLNTAVSDLITSTTIVSNTDWGQYFQVLSGTAFNTGISNDSNMWREYISTDGTAN